MNAEIKIGNEVEIGSRIVKLFGENVAICWDTSKTRKTLIHDGVEFSAVVREKTGSPYIDFVCIRTDSDSGQAYISDDSPVSGGLSIGFAEQIFVELGAAIKYIRETQGEA